MAACSSSAARASAPAGGAPAARQRGRLGRPPDRRALGLGRRRRPRRRASRSTSRGCARSSATAGWSRGRPATSCASTAPSSTSPASSSLVARRDVADPRARRGEAAARRWPSGAGRRSPTWRTSRSRRPRSPASRSCAGRRSSSGSTPIWPPAATPSSIGELEALVAEHPLRERLRGQLMLALYRSAARPRRSRRTAARGACCRSELGLEPSEELRRLEQAILQQDPSARPAAGADRAGGAEAPAVPEPLAADRAA